MVAGGFLTFFIFIIIGLRANSGLQFFDAAGDCISTNNFEILQVLGDGQAIAKEKYRGTRYASGITVLIYSENEYFYDD